MSMLSTFLIVGAIYDCDGKNPGVAFLFYILAGACIGIETAKVFSS